MCVGRRAGRQAGYGGNDVTCNKLLHSGQSSQLQRTVTAGHCGGRSGWLQWRILTVTGLSIITGMDYWTSHRFLSTLGAVMLEKNTNVGPKFLPLKAYTFSLSLKKVPKVRSDDKYDLTLSL